MPDAVLFPPSLESDAGISPCGQYRYWLTRIWNRQKPADCWCLLNPSKADAEVNDPTVRRMMAFSRSFGAGGIYVVNLFAFRATDPIELRKANYPIGPENDDAILAGIRGRRIIAAWGTHGVFLNRHWHVMKLFGIRAVFSLRITNEGHPCHPLYLPATCGLQPFQLREVC